MTTRTISQATRAQPAAASTTAVLVLMHLTVASVLITTLRRSSATR